MLVIMSEDPSMILNRKEMVRKREASLIKGKSATRIRVRELRVRPI